MFHKNTYRKKLGVMLIALLRDYNKYKRRSTKRVMLLPDSVLLSLLIIDTLFVNVFNSARVEYTYESHRMKGYL